jgi:hypothetical protein
MDLEIILDAEFFAEEDDSFALGDAEVVDCEDHCCCKLLWQSVETETEDWEAESN